MLLLERMQPDLIWTATDAQSHAAVTANLNLSRANRGLGVAGGLGDPAPERRPMGFGDPGAYKCLLGIDVAGRMAGDAGSKSAGGDK
jgi:hypothetical protein